jgi:hypothetical protein
LQVELEVRCSIGPRLVLAKRFPFLSTPLNSLAANTPRPVDFAKSHIVDLGDALFEAPATIVGAHHPIEVATGGHDAGRSVIPRLNAKKVTHDVSIVAAQRDPGIDDDVLRV